MMFEGDWGCCPQQALFAKAPKGDFVKMSEPVQVYTACQFVKGQNMALIYSNLGTIPLCLLCPIRPQVEILFSHI